MSAPPTFDLQGTFMSRKLSLYIKWLQTCYNPPSTDDALHPRNPSEGFRENHCENFIRKKKRKRKRKRKNLWENELARDGNNNAQPAQGNSNEIRIFERYPAITFDVQFNELIRAIGRQLIAFELLLFIANILINHGR